MSLIINPYRFGGGGGGYSQNMIVADGVDHFKATSLGASDTQYFTLSLWIDPRSGFITGSSNFYETAARTQITKSGSNLQILIRNTGAAIIYQSGNVNIFSNGDALSHLWMHGDFGGTPTFEIRYQGSDVTPGSPSTAPTTGTVDHTRSTYGMLAAETGGNPLNNCDWADFFLDQANSLAYSQFHSGGNPIDLSAVGSPTVLLNQNAAGLNGGSPNSGTATIAKTGTFVDA